MCVRVSVRIYVRVSKGVCMRVSKGKCVSVSDFSECVCESILSECEFARVFMNELYACVYK